MLQSEGETSIAVVGVASKFLTLSQCPELHPQYRQAQRGQYEVIAEVTDLAPQYLGVAHSGLVSCRARQVERFGGLLLSFDPVSEVHLRRPEAHHLEVEHCAAAEIGVVKNIAALRVTPGETDGGQNCGFVGA